MQVDLILDQLKYISIQEQIILSVLPNLDLPTNDAEELLKAFERKERLLAEIRKSPTKPCYNTEMKVLSELTNESLEKIKYGYSNLQHLPKNHGGIGNSNSKTRKQKEIEEA